MQKDRSLVGGQVHIDVVSWSDNIEHKNGVAMTHSTIHLIADSGDFWEIDGTIVQEKKLPFCRRHPGIGNRLGHQPDYSPIRAAANKICNHFGLFCRKNGAKVVTDFGGPLGRENRAGATSVDAYEVEFHIDTNERI